MKKAVAVTTATVMARAKVSMKERDRPSPVAFSAMLFAHATSRFGAAH